MPKVCEYFFAPHSPWTYLGHARFVALAKRGHPFMGSMVIEDIGGKKPTPLMAATVKRCSRSP